MEAKHPFRIRSTYSSSYLHELDFDRTRFLHQWGGVLSATCRSDGANLSVSLQPLRLFLQNREQFRHVIPARVQELCVGHSQTSGTGSHLSRLRWQRKGTFFFFLLPLTCSTIHSLNPARGMPWMPNLGSPLHRTWSCQGFSILRPGLGQTVALHALPTVRSCAFLIITFPFHSSFFFLFFFRNLIQNYVKCHMKCGEQ